MSAELFEGETVDMRMVFLKMWVLMAFYRGFRRHFMFRQNIFLCLHFARGMTIENVLIHTHVSLSSQVWDWTLGCATTWLPATLRGPRACSR